MGVKDLRFLAVVTLTALAACGSPLPLHVAPDGGSAGQGGIAGGSAGQSGIGQDGGAGSEPDCAPGVPVYCPDCSGRRVFNRCFNDPGAIPACIVPNCPLPTSCQGLDEATCTATPGCQPQSCQVCPGAAPTYLGCTAPGAPPIACPAVTCGIAQPCSSLAESQCQARSDCHSGYCADCSGAQEFTQCLGPNEAGACPAFACPPPSCAGRDQMTCQATPGCGVISCPNCNGGENFIGCGIKGEEVPCPAIQCPAPPPCADVTTQEGCDARSDCHPVFVENSICACAPAGCCARFSRCADGGKALCKGPTGPTPGGCLSQPPFCDGVAYIASYTSTCYEGCVPPSECASP
jgi:hypothetical protein